MIDMKRVIEEHIHSSAHYAKKHVHPRLQKMFELGGMGAVFTRAQGPYLYDAEGTEYLDMLAGGGVFFIGRNHPTVQKAMVDTAAMDIPNLCVVNASVLGGLLAGKLLEKAGEPYGKVFYGNSGAEATELAVRFARFATRRRRFLFLEGAFHGRSYAAISLCGFKQMKEGMEPLLPVCTPIPPNDIKALRAELSRGDVAGLIYEACQGMTCEVMDPNWLREAERLCKQHGTLLIADEVQTGLCRLGPWFAAHSYGVKPDLMTVSKTLSGGYMPISALLVSDEVYQKIFTDFKAGPIYFSTFAENNLAMAAGLATLDVLEEIDAPRRSLEISRQLREGLVKLADRYDCIDRIAGAGLMVGVYFKDAANSRRLRLQQQLVGAFDPGTFAAAVNVDMALRQKVIVQIPGPEINAIKVLPPVVLTDADVARFLGAFEDTLAYFYQTGPLFSLGQAALQDTARNVKRKLGMDDGTPKGTLTTGEGEGTKKKRAAVRSPADTSASGSGGTTGAPSSSTPTS